MPVDVVLVCVKGHQTAAALKLGADLIDERTTLVTLQNGWGKGDVLAEVVPPSRVVVGVTYHGGRLNGPARVVHTHQGVSHLGPFRGHSLDAANRVASILETAGFEVEVDKDALSSVWQKLVLNAAALPVAALTGLLDRLAVAAYSDRFGRRSQQLVTSSFVALVCLIALMVQPSLGVVWIVTLGLALGALFPLLLASSVDRADRRTTAGSVAGFMLLIGYGMAAVGPLVLVAARDITGAFALISPLLTGVALLLVVAAIAYGRLADLPTTTHSLDASR